MSRILFIEDDLNKMKQVIEFLLSEYPGLHVDRAGSVQSGIRRILSEQYDAVLLDMSLPTFDITGVESGGRPQVFGGRAVLKQMNRHKSKTPVVVITQFDRFGEADVSQTLEELNESLQSAHGDIYRGAVYYNATLEAWKSDLRERLRRVLSL